jgi:hypothetical protein
MKKLYNKENLFELPEESGRLTLRDHQILIIWPVVYDPCKTTSEVRRICATRADCV